MPLTRATRPPAAAFLCEQNPLAASPNNAWIPYSVRRVDNLAGGAPLVVGNATAATVVSGTLGSGAGKTANGYTNLFTSASTDAWGSAVGIFRLRGSNAGVPLFGNSSQNAAIYVDATGHLSAYISSGQRVVGATVLGVNDTFVVGFRNDPTAGYEMYLNGVRDDAGGVSGWGSIGAITAIGTAGTSFQVAVDFFGLFTWPARYFLTPAQFYELGVNPWQLLSVPTWTMRVPALLAAAVLLGQACL